MGEWVVMHEFGHAAGLYDLHHFRDSGPSLMDGTRDITHTAISSHDVDYVRGVYAGHPTPVHRPEQPSTASS